MAPPPDLAPRVHTIAQALRDAFPDVAFPTPAPIGKGYWQTKAGKQQVYYLNLLGQIPRSLLRLWPGCTGRWDEPLSVERPSGRDRSVCPAKLAGQSYSPTGV